MSKYKDDKDFYEPVIFFGEEKDDVYLQLFGLILNRKRLRKQYVGKGIRNIQDDFNLEKHRFIYKIIKGEQ